MGYTVNANHNTRLLNHANGEYSLQTEERFQKEGYSMTYRVSMPKEKINVMNKYEEIQKEVTCSRNIFLIIRE